MKINLHLERVVEVSHPSVAVSAAQVAASAAQVVPSGPSHPPETPGWHRHYMIFSTALT